MTYPTPPLPYFVKVCAWLTGLLAFCFVMALISSTGALGAGLNGVELGSQPTVATLKAKLGTMYIPPGRSPASGLPIAPASYSGFITLQGVSLRTVVSLDADGRVESISATFNPAAFYETVEGAILKKYGLPTTRGAAHQSTLGGYEVENVESDWVFPDHSTVCLLKYLLQVDTGQLMMYTEAYAIAHRQAREELSQQRPPQ